MRLLVMFDLPMQTNKQKTAYRQFRRFLMLNGYIMLQYSIYSKIVVNHAAIPLHKKKLKKALPSQGLIQVLSVTEKQFADMELLIGVKNSPTKLDTIERLIVL